jgi:hypothetical protein
MRFAWVILWLPIAASAVVEAPAAGRDADASLQHHPDKRRAALRSALKPAPGTDPIELMPPPAPMPVRRQLSEQERADLRQQLRQQGRPGLPPDRRPGLPN